ncbi:MAG: tRNA dihydrouridine synthase DusB [Alphaproteobacteria bacterium]
MKKINIGKHCVYPVFLAPMSGVSDLPFRNAVKSFGAGACVSEMIATGEAMMQGKNTLKRITPANGEDISIVQIVGSDANEMASTAKWCQDNGVDVVDINFGCPAKKITGKFCGSAIMQYPSTALQIMRKVVSAVDIPVTVKMRTGWNEENKNAPELAKMAEGEGLQMITVHGRTRQQQYTGSADWDFIKTVKDVIDIPLIVNGDIKSIDDATNALKQSTADGIMVGRGAMGKPWLLNQLINYFETGDIIETPDVKTQYDVVKKHYKEIIDFHGDYRGMLMGRKHLSWYLSGFKNATSIRKQIMDTNDVDTVISLIDAFYQKQIKDCG